MKKKDRNNEDRLFKVKVRLMVEYCWGLINTEWGDTDWWCLVPALAKQSKAVKTRTLTLETAAVVNASQPPQLANLMSQTMLFQAPPLIPHHISRTDHHPYSKRKAWFATATSQQTVLYPNTQPAKPTLQSSVQRRRQNVNLI